MVTSKTEKYFRIDLKNQSVKFKAEREKGRRGDFNK
jgi:hypothetical protein